MADDAMERIRTGLAVIGFILVMWGGCAPPPDEPRAYTSGDWALWKFAAFAVGLVLFGMSVESKKK
jgi:hypothetical protein